MGKKEKLDEMGRAAGGAPSSEAEVPLGESSGVRFIANYIRRDRSAFIASLAIIVFLVWSAIEGLLQLIGPYIKDRTLGWAILPGNPFVINYHLKLAPPTLANFPSGILGFNFSGESILTRILYAAPRDALAATLVVFSAIVIGMLLGITAGYVGGWADEILMRVTDAFLAFPALVLAITLTVILGNGYTVVLITLVVIWWPTYARFFRAQTLSLRSRGYVEASKLSGLGPVRIMLRHIFPNAVDPIIAIATLDLGNVILTYSTLAFLGIGLQIGVPEWGSMASTGLAFIPGVWWDATFPGLVILLTVVCFSLLGDRLQDLVGGRISY